MTKIKTLAIGAMMVIRSRLHKQVAIIFSAADKAAVMCGGKHFAQSCVDNLSDEKDEAKAVNTRHLLHHFTIGDDIMKKTLSIIFYTPLLMTVFGGNLCNRRIDTPTSGNDTPTKH